MLKRYYPWVIFLSILLLLVFGSTPWANEIDWMLWPLRFGVLAGFSVLLVWSRWRHRDGEGRVAHRDLADHFLSSARRWFHGEQNNDNKF